MNKLQELLGQYFDCGVAEGKENRSHDTVDGDAQKSLQAILEHVKSLVSAERETCAKLMEMKNDEVRLLAGEMTAQEMRTVQAVMANRAAVIRRRGAES